MGNLTSVCFRHILHDYHLSLELAILRVFGAKVAIRCKIIRRKENELHMRTRACRSQHSSELLEAIFFGLLRWTCLKRKKNFVYECDIT